jgi:hypothetical protein
LISDRAAHLGFVYECDYAVCVSMYTVRVVTGAQ